MEEKNTGLIDWGKVYDPKLPEELTKEDYVGQFRNARMERHQKELRAKGVLEALLKAEFDSFVYAMRLRTGEFIQFGECSIDDDGENCHLSEITEFFPNPYSWNFERGLDIKVADIVWVADAPYGS